MEFIALIKGILTLAALPLFAILLPLLASSRKAYKPSKWTLYDYRKNR